MSPVTSLSPVTPRGVLVVTDRRQAAAPLPVVVAAAVAGGARWVLLREKDLPRADRAALADRLRRVLEPAGGRLIVAGPDPLGGDAVHLAATDPPAGPRAEPPAGPRTEPPVGPRAEPPADPRSAGPALVGRSCHTAAELTRLTTEDYLTLSPVFPSRSKPGYGPALGPAGLAELCRRADRPVIALGGVETPSQAAACVAAGAAGVAVMGVVMRAADPADVRAVVAALAATTAHPSGAAR